MRKSRVWLVLVKFLHNFIVSLELGLPLLRSRMTLTGLNVDSIVKWLIHQALRLEGLCSYGSTFAGRTGTLGIGSRQCRCDRGCQTGGSSVRRKPGIATISRMGREVVGAPCTDARTVSSCRPWEERGLGSQGVDQTAQ